MMTCDVNSEDQVKEASKRIESEIFLQCEECKGKLASGDFLRFYIQLHHGVHLIIKSENQEAYLNAAKPPVRLKIQGDEKRRIISSHELLCRCCGAAVGSINRQGAENEPMVCFNSTTTKLFDGERLLYGRWAKIMDYVTVISKYDEKFTIEKKISSLGGVDRRSSASPLRLPSVQDFMKISLRDLVRDRPRSYQLECFVAAAQHNTIVYLPTGAGKTLIAALLASLMNQLNPTRTILFIVDRVPLVFQQSQYIADQTRLVTSSVCGENSEDIPLQRLLDFSVIIVTAQIAVNWLSRGHLRMEDVSLIIFDEIHHTIKSHPYAVLMEIYYKLADPAQKPLLLGLTASPVTTGRGTMDANIEQLCEKTRAQIFMPIIYSKELSLITRRPQVQFIAAESTPDECIMTSALTAYCYIIIREVWRMLGESEVPESISNLTNTIVGRGYLRVLTDKAHDKQHKEALMLLIHLQQFFSAQELNNILGPRFARKYLEKLFHKRQTNDPYSDLANHLLSKISNLDSLSSKLSRLMTLLEGINPEDQTRAIIFVQTKKTARTLSQFLNESEELQTSWRPGFFIGHSEGQIDGMSWSEHQAPTLENFRTGRHKLLVSTSVLEEGLDVPICSHVILFDQSRTLTSFIQSRGRARAHDSHYIFICNPTQQIAHRTLMDAEPQMQKAILKRMQEMGTFTKSIIFLTLHLKSQVAQFPDWEENQTKSPNDSLREVRKTFKVLQIFIHNLPYGGDSETQTSLISLFSDFPLQNLSTDFGIDAFFSEKSCLSVKAEPTGEIMLKISTICKILTSLSQKLSSTGALISFQVMDRNRSGGSTEQIVLMATSLSTGTFIQPQVFYSDGLLETPLKVVIDIESELVQIFFICESRILRLDYGFSSIDKFVIIDLGDDSDVVTSLYLPMCRAAFAYSAQAGSTKEVKLAIPDRFAWERATVLETPALTGLVDAAAIRLDLLSSGVNRDRMVAIMRRSTNHGLGVLYAKMENVSYESVEAMLTRDDLIKLTDQVQDFDSFFGLQVLSSNCPAALFYRVSREKFTESVVTTLSGKKRCQLLAELALELPLNRYSDVMQIVERIKQRLLSEPEPLESITLPHKEANLGRPNCPSTLALVRFLTLTPATTLFPIPKKILLNRILRIFNPDYFLRVTFRDEDLTKLSSIGSGASLEAPLNRISKVLREGIFIGKRHYEFLAMSSSQLRDHGCWFVAPHDFWAGPQLGYISVDASYIRQWCGDLSSIKNVAKHVARLGQSLSASYEVATIEPKAVKVIPDYTTIAMVGKERRTFTFSDGIGMISHSLSKEISARLGMTHIPTAFQIRFAGFKGVLAIPPHAHDENDTEHRIWFRPSMKKFTSKHDTLEVLSWSQNIQCYLNRQVLMILSSLGVPDTAFLDLQTCMLEHMAKVLLDKQTALCSLQENCYKFPNFVNLKELESYGVSTDPFFRSILLTIYRQQMTGLLSKTRVFVPSARILMGVIDETGTLAEDEVFVQISRTSTDQKAIDAKILLPGYDEDRLMIVVGSVAVAKNPCMHPGDIRSLRAVDSAKLRRTHYDCIVFPRKGLRPITDMCSGSDLDGDLYFVTWDSSILPRKIYPPMDYTCPPSKEVAVVNLESIREFNIKFIKNDQLGVIANAHVAHADILPQGVAAPLCQKLAYLFSLAVDFPKTGLLPTLPKDASVETWPDFMGKIGKSCHISKKVLGQMFRQVKSLKSPHYLIKSSTIRIDQVYLKAGYETFVEPARKIYQQYSRVIGNILTLYGIPSESLIFYEEDTGIKKRGGEGERSHALKLIREEFTLVVSRYRDLFFTLAKGDEERLLMASAWYYVTYDEPQQPKNLDSPILSFPWLVWDFLLKVRTENFHSGGKIQEPETMNLLGMQVFNQARDIIIEDLNGGLVQRRHFITLLTSLIYDSLGEGVEVIPSGSVSSYVMNLASDINIYVRTTPITLYENLAPAISNLFLITYRHGMIEFRGSPFSFTIFCREEWHLPAACLRKLMRTDLDTFAIVLVVLRWARAHHLVRSSAKHSGKVSATAFALFCIQILKDEDDEETGTRAGTETETEMGDSTLPLGSVSEESIWLGQVSNYLKEATLKTFGRVGTRMAKLLRNLWLYKEINVEKIVSSMIPSVDIPSDVISSLSDYGFQGYQLVAQTLNVQSLWEASYCGMVEVEVFTNRKRPRLSRRMGVLSPRFVAGSGNLLFKNGQSPTQGIEFDLYRQRRRPNHYNSQCYVPILREMMEEEELEQDFKRINGRDIYSGFLYEEFFAHSFRQFDLARKTGSVDFGMAKVSIKWGHLYVLGLPRLFVEDVMAATIERVQEALRRGYQTVSDSLSDRFLQGPNGDIQLGLALSTSLNDENENENENGGMEERAKNSRLLEDIISQMAEGMDEMNASKPIIVKRPTLGPMCSAFDPKITNDKRLKEFLEANHFTVEVEVQRITTNLTLYNESAKSNCQFQVRYDSKMNFQFMTYNPLRWMLVDVKNTGQDGELDYRFILSSTKQVNLDQCKSTISNNGVNITDRIKKGVIEFEDDETATATASPRQRPKVVPEFRANEHVYARTGTSKVFSLPTPMAIQKFMNSFPALKNAPLSIFHTLRITINYVTEYSLPDPCSGVFKDVYDKTEVELSFLSDWEDLGAVTNDYIQSLLPAVWTLCHIFHPYIR